MCAEPHIQEKFRTVRTLRVHVSRAVAGATEVVRKVSRLMPGLPDPLVGKPDSLQVGGSLELRWAVRPSTSRGCVTVVNSTETHLHPCFTLEIARVLEDRM
ncbi:hypothetical protein GCM10027262_42010 [Nocardia tengchongensis]